MMLVKYGRYAQQPVHDDIQHGGVQRSSPSFAVQFSSSCEAVTQNLLQLSLSTIVRSHHCDRRVPTVSSLLMNTCQHRHEQAEIWSTHMPKRSRWHHVCPCGHLHTLDRTTWKLRCVQAGASVRGQLSHLRVSHRKCSRHPCVDILQPHHAQLSSTYQSNLLQRESNPLTSL